MREALRARRRRPWRLAVLVAILTAWTGTAVWHSNKPMPPGTNVDAPWQPVPVSSVRLIADVTEFMTLNAGDVLLTGVPEGAPRTKAGDRIRIEIEQVGKLENTVVPEDEWIPGGTL